MANLLTYPSGKFSFNGDGQINPEYFNFFSMNNQEFQLYFSNDGHLVPTRTDDELVGANSLSTTQYTARYAYNGTTDNHMANTAGEYKNITMNTLDNPLPEMLSATLPSDRIELLGATDQKLFVNVDGNLSQIPLVDPATPISISASGTSLVITFNGVSYYVLLTPV